jgi:xylulokinase
MYLLGIDIGTSFIKVSVVNADDQSIIAAIQYPETEREIISLKQDWAEQNPEQWWEDVKMAIKKANALKLYNTTDIKAIGITYQMHGLVLLDNNKNTLRNAIIWCDSRAVNVGEEAFEKIGKEKCLIHLLNSPGNFTAAKLAWVKQNEPALFEKVHTVMLPGDFINFKLTGEINTSIAALSEGIFWDFKNNELSKDVFDYFGFDTNF